VQYTDPAEMRQESDRIAAWLRHGSPSADEREILQMEYQNLAGLLEQDRQERATQQRLDKVQQALTPKTKADPQLTDAQNAKAQLMEAVRLIDSIKPLPGREMEFSYVMSGDEMIVIPAELEVHIPRRRDAEVRRRDQKDRAQKQGYPVILRDFQRHSERAPGDQPRGRRGGLGLRAGDARPWRHQDLTHQSLEAVPDAL